MGWLMPEEPTVNRNSRKQLVFDQFSSYVASVGTDEFRVATDVERLVVAISCAMPLDKAATAEFDRDTMAVVEISAEAMPGVTTSSTGWRLSSGDDLEGDSKGTHESSSSKEVSVSLGSAAAFGVFTIPDDIFLLLFFAGFKICCGYFLK